MKNMATLHRTFQDLSLSGWMDECMEINFISILMVKVRLFFLSGLGS